MSCAQCQGIQRLFNARTARRELKRYRKRGPTGATRALIDALRLERIEGASLLDIGGGVGAIQHELLEAGAASAVDVDASGDYLGAAREEAERRGHADRHATQFGDFVEVAHEVEPADVVTLDKVICCYPDMERLVGLSVERSRRLYGLVYPRDVLPFRLAARAINVYMWLRRSPFRVFVHPPLEVDRLIRSRGLEQRFAGRAEYVWHVAVYARGPG